VSYPSFEQYNNALQAHQRLLTDPELQRGSVAKTGLGIPLAISGGFALTYTISSGSKKYAVRCFHRESKALERRYQAIAKRLAALKSQYFLDFEFQAKGINVDGGSYPIVKMAWVLISVQNFPDFRGKQRPIVSTPGCATIRRFGRRIWGVKNGSHSRNPASSLGQQREHQLDCA
jgi:hypothetical protein